MSLMVHCRRSPTKLGLLKKEVKRIHRIVEKSVAKYLSKSPSEYKVELRTPQSLLLADGAATDNKGGLQAIKILT